MAAIVVIVVHFTENAGHEPTGHRPETENEKALCPVGLDGIVVQLFIHFLIILGARPK